jgi:hypothetical protein
VTHRALPLLLLALCAVAAPACASRGAAQAGAVPTAPSAGQTPMRFRRMTAMVGAAQADRARGDAALLRRRSAALSNEGIALIQATMPHDVARTDVPRYLDGRAVFGEALKGWVQAVESGSDADVYAALDRLDGSLRGWIDAYTGLPPETSI